MKVEIRKVDLMEGEELQELVKRVIGALGQQKAKLKKSLFLHGIFKDHVIARDFETGAFFKMDMARKGEEVTLSNMTKVVQTFVAAGAAVKKSEDQQAQPLQVVEVPAMLVTLEDGKLTESSIQNIQEVTKSEVQEGQFLDADQQAPKESIWGNVLD